jgi:HD-GYP domain-containing protein (c-di-GMP phosphodiesterase class II)
MFKEQIFLMFHSPMAENRIAFELASRLKVALIARIYLFEKLEAGWRCSNSTDQLQGLDPIVLAMVDDFNIEQNTRRILRQSGQLVVASNATFNSSTCWVIVVVLPDQESSLVCAVIDAHLEALKYRNELEVSNQQVEQFIDQVTQDFEELTWLRKANDYFDLCDSTNTIESIASACLPDLAHVIAAESILFVLPESAVGPESLVPDRNRYRATDGLVVEPTVCLDFLTDSLPQLSGGPLVANEKSLGCCLANYPGLRNCIAITVIKDGHVYGWLMAVNKKITSPEPSLAPSSKNQAQSSSFGTFEAGLLGAAASIMASQSRNRELFEAQEMLLTGTVRAVINAIDAKDPYTCGHSDRVASYAKRIAARMGSSEEECERIYMAGLLHDVGKIGIPDSILGKPGKLTPEEYAVIKKHPEIGHTILKHLKLLDYVLPGVLHHHEAVDGSGYPMGLVGEAIPLAGRILAVADAYDAMTSHRPYRHGMPSEKAESILRDESGKMWDSDIVAVFLECLANEDIRPHSIPNAAVVTDDRSLSNSSDNLMWRIATSISSIAAG